MIKLLSPHHRALAPLLLAFAGIAYAQTATNTISLSPSTLTINTPTGTASSPQPVTVTSSGGPVAFTTSVSPAASWLTVSPPAGTTPQALSISANPGLLTTGTYATFLTVTAGSSTATLPIVLNVTSGGGNSPLSPTPGSLAFTFQTGSTTPQTQQVSIATTTPLGGVTVTPILSSGANWLTVSPTSTSLASSTPTPVSVTVNPALLPAAGVYNAIVAISPPGTTGVAIPVTVTVAAPAAVNVNPQQLTFYFQTGTSNPLPQTINVTSVSGAAVAFSAAASTTSCGNNWLIVTPQNTATPAPLSVQINPAGLQVGNCTGQITITAPGSATPTQTIPVNLVVTNSPLLQIPTTGPTFTYQLNSNTQIPAQNFQITSSGTAIAFNVSATPVNGGANFLTVTPSSGTSPSSVALGISQSVLATLAPGTYTENVTVTSTGAGNSPQTFPVTLVVSNNPILNASQPSLTFNFQSGQTAPTSQVLTLTSTGAPLNFNASAASSNCGNFLTVSPGTGMTQGTPGQTGQIVVSASPTGITAPTTCTGTITLTVPGSTNPPVVLPVTFNVASNPIINTSLPVINVTALAGSTTISQQVVALTSTDLTTPLNFTATASTNPQGLSWLAVTPNTGTTPTNLTVIINAANLQPGTYTGSINITSSNANVPAQSIPVVLTVVSAFITPSPTTLSFMQALGGQGPASQTISIPNLPAGTTISATPTTLTGGSGWLTATTGANGTITISANGANLQQGVYQGVVTIIAPGTTPSPLYVPVTFTVGSPQVLTFSTGAVGFNFQQGATTLPGAQTLQVTTNGNAVPINVAFTPVTGGQFVTVTPATGNTPGPLSIALNQSVVSTLQPGSYTGIVTVSSPSIPNGAQSIPITLVVAPQGPPVVTAIVNAASNQPGAVAPGELVTIYGNGVGPTAPYFLTLTPSGSVATTAGDLTVTFDGIAAPITFANATQINVIVPYEIAGRATTTLVVKRTGGSSNPIQLQVANTAPAIFSLSQGGSGQGAILNQDNSINGSDHPAPKGSTIVIYATGGGQVNPAALTGAVTSTAAPFPLIPSNVPVTLTIGGVPAQIVYKGSAPGLASGVIQINAIVPQTVASGNQPISLTIGNNTSLPNITVAVQ